MGKLDFARSASENRIQWLLVIGTMNGHKLEEPPTVGERVSTGGGEYWIFA